jgi:anaerobic selenocysteine-containing dehydrogenase
LIHGEVSYLLPCLGRIEVVQEATGAQALSVEDSTTCIHGSRGVAEPASPHLLSEPRIIAELAKTTLPPNPRVDWDAWADDYSLVRDAIEQTYPDQFKDFNQRMWQPGGFPRPIAARDRVWKTETGKANFIVPKSLSEDIDTPAERRDILQLITLRSNGQFNTTIYSYDDRFRGVYGTRRALLMHRNDIDRLNLRDGATVTVICEAGDDVHREVQGLVVTPYDIPEGCCAGYYPECNPLIPLWHHAERSKVPAAKSIPVSIAVMTAEP